MVTYTPEQKANRKQSIKSREYVAMLDRENPPSKSATFMHPRWYNKPLECQMGKHKFFLDMTMGIPFMTCAKCGYTTLKGAHEGNQTKREMRSNTPLVKPMPVRDILHTFYPYNRRI